jgi:hypothetical protein
VILYAWWSQNQTYTQLASQGLLISIKTCDLGLYPTWNALSLGRLHKNLQVVPTSRGKFCSSRGPLQDYTDFQPRFHGYCNIILGFEVSIYYGWCNVTYTHTHTHTHKWKNSLWRGNWTDQPKRGVQNTLNPSNKTSPRCIMEPQNITTRLETQHHIFPHILWKLSRCDFLALKEVLLN